MLITTKQYTENNNLDVSRFIEKKDNGKFVADYISWANAQMLLKTRHPELSVDFERVDGCPVFNLGSQSYVLPFLTDGKNKTPSLFYPVWDNRFNPIDDASVWDVNRAIQRATAKIIAVETGLGLCCYIGEDLQHTANKPKFYEQVSASNKIMLNVPFQEKDEAKALGARYDPSTKRWYATDQNIQELKKWQPAEAEDIKPPQEQEQNNDMIDPDLEENVPF